ncbi:RNA polymerase factor sigma-70 [Pseudomonas syringae]|nr:RNA polymerase factor sigma-70 [Pseudomonas syringae]
MQEYGSVTPAQETSAPSLLEALLDNRTTLIKTAARITGCHSRAEDVVQDAFLRLAKTPKMALPLRAQISYVFRIVRNLAIDHYRKQAMEQKYSGTEEEGLNVAIQGSTPESQNLDHETLMIVDAALNELPRRTRYAFESYRLHGVPQKDIAKELGVSPTLVNFMIRDAMVHCRKVLGERVQ